MSSRNSPFALLIVALACSCGGETVRTPDTECVPSEGDETACSSLHAQDVLRCAPVRPTAAIDGGSREFDAGDGGAPDGGALDGGATDAGANDGGSSFETRAFRWVLHTTCFVGSTCQSNGLTAACIEDSAPDPPDDEENASCECGGGEPDPEPPPDPEPAGGCACGGDEPDPDPNPMPDPDPDPDEQDDPEPTPDPDGEKKQSGCECGGEKEEPDPDPMPDPALRARAALGGIVTNAWPFSLLLLRRHARKRRSSS